MVVDSFQPRCVGEGQVAGRAVLSAGSRRIGAAWPKDIDPVDDSSHSLDSGRDFLGELLEEIRGEAAVQIDHIMVGHADDVAEGEVAAVAEPLFRRPMDGRGPDLAVDRLAVLRRSRYRSHAAANSSSVRRREGRSPEQRHP